MKETIVFATGNEGKMREIRLILADLGMEILSMKDAGVNPEINENGKSFGENAEIKAMAVWKETGGIVLADDSGLVVDYLGGEPGILSARYLGEDTSYAVKNQVIIDRLAEAEGEERAARFVCNIAAVLPDGRVIHTEETMEGQMFGEEKVICCIAQGMDAVRFGKDLSYSRFGELRIGILKKGENVGQENRLQALGNFLDRAGIPYVVEEDIRYRLWGKFMLNVGVNQTCMAFETNYGGALAPGEAYDTMVNAMEEVICLANLEGVPLSRKDLDDYIALLRTLSPEGMPSMRQDGIAHRPTEVELFAGTVRKLAAKHGQKVPVNDWLYEKICGMEKAWREN